MNNKMLYLKTLHLLQVKEEDLLGPGKQQDLVQARCLMVAVLMKRTMMRQREVAEILNTGQASVSKMLQRHELLLKIDELYRKRWEIINQ